MNSVKKRFLSLVDALTTEKAFFLLIIVTMIAIPVGELFTQLHDRAMFTQPLIVEAVGILGTFMAAADIIKRRNERLYPTDLFFFLLIVLAGLSLAFSQDMLESTRGLDFDEWLTDFLGYFSLMYAASAVKDNRLRKYILGTFLFVLALQGTISILQTFGIRIRDSYFDSVTINKFNYPFGLTQHHNWLAPLAGLYTCFTAGMTLFAKTKRSAVIYWLLTCVGLYNMLTTGTRLAVMTIAVMFVFYMISIPIYCRRRREGMFRQLSIRLTLIFAATAAIFAVCYFGFGHYKGEFSVTISEMTSVSANNGISDNTIAVDEKEKQGFLMPEASAVPHSGFDVFANHRGFIWKYGLACVPEYWAFGIGLDNYKWCFTHPQRGLPPDSSNYSVGKAHNEYIHILVTQGVFQLINYLSLYIYTVIVGIRTVLRSEDKEHRTVTWIALGMFIAYAAQAVFNSSLVNVAPYFWITMGLILCVKDQRPFGRRKNGADGKDEAK